jgi:hypothetical protein
MAYLAGERTPEFYFESAQVAGASAVSVIERGPVELPHQGVKIKK